MADATVTTADWTTSAIFEMSTTNGSLGPSTSGRGDNRHTWLVDLISTTGSVGLLLNLAVIAVLIQKRIRSSATDLYLLTLAVGKLGLYNVNNFTTSIIKCPRPTVVYKSNPRAGIEKNNLCLYYNSRSVWGRQIFRFHVTVYTSRHHLVVRKRCRRWINGFVISGPPQRVYLFVRFRVKIILYKTMLLSKIRNNDNYI